MSTQPVVDALKREINEWKQAYGAKLNENTKGAMKRLADSMEEKLLQLTRKVWLVTSRCENCVLIMSAGVDY